MAGYKKVPDKKTVVAIIIVDRFSKLQRTSNWSNTRRTRND